MTRPSMSKQRAGWVLTPIRKHFCFPPRSFPQGVAPGAVWRCPYAPCRVTWQSYGVLLLHGLEDWPHAYNEQAVMGPDRWRILGWYEGDYEQCYDGEFPKDPAQIKIEHDMYDFRAMSMLYLKFMNKFATGEPFVGRDLYD